MGKDGMRWVEMGRGWKLDTADSITVQQDGGGEEQNV